jgi:hypothetical protein
MILGKLYEKEKNLITMSRMKIESEKKKLFRNKINYERNLNKSLKAINNESHL